MPRASSGQVIEDRRNGRRVYAIRFRAAGKRHYVTLGSAEDGWTRKRAEAELQNVLADVRRGIWRPPEPEPEPPEPRQDPTFHEFASEWFESKQRELRPTTVNAYRWELTHHLLPFFRRHRLSQITVEEVDRYRSAKVREREALRATLARGEEAPRRPLSNETINKTIARLAQVLEVAVEYGYIARNPALGKRRRLKVARPRARYLDRATQIAALLEAAGKIDAEARWDRQRYRRPLLAVLVFGGLRIGEALALRWRDVDLAGGRLRIGDSKTDAGVRDVPLAPALYDELAAYRAGARYTEPGDRVFCTRTGGRLSKDNTRQRVLHRAIDRADDALVKAGDAPLPEGLKQHSMRHTYISLRMALGHDLATVSQDVGHSDMAVTYRVYTHVMRLDEGERDRLRALWEGAAYQLAELESDLTSNHPTAVNDVGR